MDTLIVNESEVAKEYKRQIRAHLNDICVIMNDARMAGFDVEFNLGNTQSGQAAIARLAILKRY